VIECFAVGVDLNFFLLAFGLNLGLVSSEFVVLGQPFDSGIRFKSAND